MFFSRSRLSGLMILPLFMLLYGCGGGKPVQADRLFLDPHASGDNQCAAYGQPLPKPLRVIVEGKTRGFWGGEESHPVAGVAVRFKVDNPECGAVFPETGLPELTMPSDAGGVASARLTLGGRPGDVIVSATADTIKGSTGIELRAVAGVECIQSTKETSVDGVVNEVGVRLTDPSGAPAVGVPVYLKCEASTSGPKVDGQPAIMRTTDSDGRAVATWRLGGAVRPYYLTAEIQDNRPGISEDMRFHVRGVEFKAMATSYGPMLITLTGGLALFLLGMKIMSDALQRMADRRLKAILGAMTRNRFMGTAVGAIVTSVIQSSSATTVMTIGFVNAGLMTLNQAIGVIFGANIGTTMTAQVIAFRLEDMAYPAIAIGLLVSVMAKRTTVIRMGEGVMGFGLLFLGMNTMSGVLGPLKNSPEFISWFQMLDCSPATAGGMIHPTHALLCILIGTAATMMIQSSSATVGLVLALCSQDLISFYTAFPLVLGDNIGTTITAILASLGANRNAKRAAIAHTMFNLIGALYMFLLLLLPLWHGRPIFLGFVDWLTPGEAFAAIPENLPRHVANSHSLFNVFNAIVFLPFVPALARLCQRIIPVTAADQDQVLQYLEPRLLMSPSIAVAQAVREVAYMMRRAQKSLHESCEFFYTGDTKLEQDVINREQMIDRLQSEITGYLVALSRKDLPPEEATLIPALIHAVNDAERIGDHSEELLGLRYASAKASAKPFSDAAVAVVTQVRELLDMQFDDTYRSLIESDASKVDVVIAREQEITKVIENAMEMHIHRLENSQCDVQTGVFFLDMLTHLERVGDHLMNIAERAGKYIQLTKE